MPRPLSVVGLGKLGLCLASCFAERGFETIGVDVDEQVVASVNRGKAPFFEPGLDALIARHGGADLRATTRHGKAIDETDVTFVLVPTPSNPDGSLSNRFVESALKSLALAFGESKKEHHLFVISSTVMPGSTGTTFIPMLETYSGRKLNEDFSVCYDPDFVALGNVINGFSNPDLVIIGQTSNAAGEQIETLHRAISNTEPTVSHMSIINAELAKVCLNAYITLKISFANSVANLCECIPGADVDAITQAIGADKRISPYYFQGGPSFGGTCFPRDTRAYCDLADRYRVQADIIRAADRVNMHQDQHLADLVVSEVERLESRTVGILGLAFTFNTPVVTESPAIKLIQNLLRHDLRIIAYDALAIDNAKAVLGDAIEYALTAEDCLARSDLCVLTLRSSEIKCAIENYRFARPLTLVDCWRAVDSGRLSKQVKYIPLGRRN